MAEIEKVAKAGGIRRKIGNPRHFIDLLEDIPSEKVATSFFNTKNYKALQEIKKYLPQEFELLREHRLSVIAKNSMVEGVPNVHKFLRQVKGLEKEARELLFGKGGSSLIDHIKTIADSFPAKVGASDTPRGLAWWNHLDDFWNPVKFVSREATNAMHYIGILWKTTRPSGGQHLEGMTKAIGQAAPRLGGYFGIKELSNKILKGPDKWASDGYEKLQENESFRGAGLDKATLMGNRKTKELLVRASTLRQGSPAMIKVIEQLKNYDGGQN